MYALVWSEFRRDTEVLEVAMEKRVEELGEDIFLVDMKVLVSREPLLRLQLDHVTNHSLWQRNKENVHYIVYL